MSVEVVLNALQVIVLVAFLIMCILEFVQNRGGYLVIICILLFIQIALLMIRNIF